MGDKVDAATMLLLHMNGTNNSTTFTDSSLRHNNMTAGGNAKISTSQYKFGGSSGYFDNTINTRLYCAANNNYLLGTADFTLEMWIYLDLTNMTGGWQELVQIGSDATDGVFGLTRYSTSNPMGIRVDYYSNGWYSALDVTDAGIQANTWHHIALVRAEGTFNFFVDGTSKGSNAANINYTQNTLYIGGRSGGTSTIKGYLDDFRFTLGYARYTSNFAAPTSEFTDPSNFSGIIQTPIQSNPEFSGNYQIVGTVDRLGLAGSYKIRLFDRKTGICIGDTFSNSTGAYAFTGLSYRANRYFVVAYDHSGTPLNAAIADLVTPEPMP